MRNTSAFAPPRFRFRFDTIRLLFIRTLPLCLCLFLQVYTINMPKYAIDRYMAVEMQAVYGIIFMPAAFVNLLGSFIFRPVLTTLSALWDKRAYKEMRYMCVRRILLLMLITVFAVIIGYFIGTPILSVIYGLDVRKYRLELAIILLGGGFAGISALLYFMATVIRRQYSMLICFFSAFCVSAAAAYPLVRAYGLLGAACCYLLTNLIVNITITFLIFRLMHRVLNPSEYREPEKGGTG